MKRKLIIITLIAIVLMVLLRDLWLGYLGESLVVDEPDARADVAVVLTTGVGYIPRLLQAARLYRNKQVEKVLINGNRKSAALRKLEQEGFEPCCEAYENSLRILEMHGVPRSDVWTIDGEDVFDTVSEAQNIRPFLEKHGVDSMIITTSKFHTRRARYVWRKVMGREEGIYASAASDDPFDPEGWWKQGNQVKQVMGEYGGLVYYLWKRPWQ